MSEASQALQKIVKGTVISRFFGFLSRAIIAREFSKAEYGVFNLVLIVWSNSPSCVFLGISVLQNEEAPQDLAKGNIFRSELLT